MSVTHPFTTLDERTRDKTVKSPRRRPAADIDNKRQGRKSASERGDPPEPKEIAPPPEEEGDENDLLRAYLRAAGVPSALLKPMALSIRKLVELALTNRGGLQSCLNYINGQPSSSLPVEAPEYFRNRPIDPGTGKRETIVKFLERVWYHPWIEERLLTRTALRRLDLPAATALNNFLHAPKERWEPKNQLPEHLVVPTKSEVNDALLEDADRVREARRIVDARWRRQRGLVRGKK